MKRDITIHEYIEWRNKTNGCLTATEIHYTLGSPENPSIYLEGTIEVTEQHRDKVRQGWYSSAILAALDSTDFKAMLDHVPEEIGVRDDTALTTIRTPTFCVRAIDEEATGATGDKITIVYVEGRI